MLRFGEFSETAECWRSHPRTHQAMTAVGALAAGVAAFFGTLGCFTIVSGVQGVRRHAQKCLNASIEVVRCLGTGATMLLLDEPAAGMGKTETDRLAALIDEVRKQGRGVLLVDHDMGFIFSVCDSITVMNAGRVIADGTPHEIERSETVREAYLGGHAESSSAGGFGTGRPGEA